MSEAKEETIKRLAYVIWQERIRRGEPDGGDAEKNYFMAQKVLYPEDIKKCPA
ncbi:MAG: hypothetical protein WCI77_08120 [Candidatus Omnitrophota bacterium]